MKILINEQQYNFLLESEEKFISLGEKYFPKINEKIVKKVYSKLKEYDSLSTYNFNWILLLIENKIPNVLEDLNEYAQYLNIFDRFKHKIKQNGNQIELFNKQTKKLIYDSKSSLYSVVESFFLLEKSDLMSNIGALSKTGEIDITFEDDKMITFALLTYNASKILCSETNFCTRFPDQYKHYTKTSPLFVFVNKENIAALEKDPDLQYEKYPERVRDAFGQVRTISRFIPSNIYKYSIIQYDDHSGDFRDRQDQTLSKKIFFKENPDAVLSIFKKYINKINKTQIFEFTDNIDNVIKLFDIKEKDVIWRFNNSKYQNIVLFKKNNNLLLFKTYSHWGEQQLAFYNFNPLTKVFSGRKRIYYSSSSGITIMRLETLIKLDPKLEQILKDNNIKLVDIEEKKSDNFLRDLEEKFKLMLDNNKSWVKLKDVDEIIINKGENLNVPKGIRVPLVVKLNGGSISGDGNIADVYVNTLDSKISKSTRVGKVHLTREFDTIEKVLNILEGGFLWFEGKSNSKILPIIDIKLNSLEEFNFIKYKTLNNDRPYFKYLIDNVKLEKFDFEKFRYFGKNEPFFLRTNNLYINNFNLKENYELIKDNNFLLNRIAKNIYIENVLFEHTGYINDNKIMLKLIDSISNKNFKVNNVIIDSWMIYDIEYNIEFLTNIKNKLKNSDANVIINIKKTETKRYLKEKGLI